MRNLSNTAQEWPTTIIESSDGGRMEVMQRRGEPSVDPRMMVIQAGYSA
jgi:hypothetical protein